MKSAVFHISYSNKSLIGFSISVVLIYIFSILIAAGLANSSFNKFKLFEPVNKFSLLASLFLNPVILLSGITIIMFIPGILFVYFLIRRKLEFLDFLVYSSIINTALLILGSSLFKFFTKQQLNRFNFMLIICIMITVAILLKIIRFKEYVRKNIFSYKVDFIKLILLGIIVLFCIILFLRNFSGISIDFDFSENALLKIPFGQQDDLFEVVGLTDSLRMHLYPYWDLEYNDKLGFHVIDPPLSYYFYLFAILLFGNSFISFGLFFLLSIIIMIIICFSIAQMDINIQNRYYIIILPIFLSCILFFSNLPERYLLGVFLLFPVFLHYYFLISRKYIISLIFAIMSFLMSYESIFLICLGFIIFNFLFRDGRYKLKHLFRRYLYAIFLYLCFIVLVGILRGDLMTYIKSIFIEKFMRFDYFGIIFSFFPEQLGAWPSSRFYNNWAFIKWALLSSSFLVIILFLPKKDKISTFFSWVGLIYFFTILVSRYKRPHYVVLLIMITALVVPRYICSLNKMFKKNYNIKS